MSKLDQYKVGLEIALNEGHVLWSFSQTFLIANTIILGFISQSSKEAPFSPNTLVFFLSVIGFVVTMLWLSAYMRRSYYYEFRIDQIKQVEPNEWELFKGRGENFSKGKEVSLNNKSHHIPFLGRIKTRHAAIVFISLFIVIYTILLWKSFPFQINLQIKGMGYLWLFLIIGVFFGLLQASYSNDIYEFHPDPGEEKRKELKQKKQIIKNAPLPWKIERWLHIFTGVLIGWLILWVLLDMRLNLFSGSPLFSQLNIVDLVLFILSWIGINGRLPTIAHDVQNWFRR